MCLNVPETKSVIRSHTERVAVVLPKQPWVVQSQSLQ